MTQAYVYGDNLDSMIASFEAIAPTKPNKGGWFGSISSDNEGHLICPIEDYDIEQEGHPIIQIGSGHVSPEGVYIEY